MPFDASEVTDLLKFRLRKVEPDGTETPYRHVPSPTQDEVDKFSDAYRGAQRSAVGITEAEADADKDAYQARLDNLTTMQRRAMGEEILEHVIEFCKGTPSAAELTEMGALERLGFVYWLIGVLSPLL